jgi:ADP-ribosylglycohydrolase
VGILADPNSRGFYEKMGCTYVREYPSTYEASPIKTKAFPLFDERSRFTDDTVLTVAVADAILTGRSYRQCLWELGRSY